MGNTKHTAGYLFLQSLKEVQARDFKREVRALKRRLAVLHSQGKCLGINFPTLKQIKEITSKWKELKQLKRTK